MLPRTDISRVKNTPAYIWAMDVLRDKTTYLNCELVKLACERFMRDIKRKDLYFDLDEYDRLNRYLAMFKHSKGLLAGKPFIMRPDQQFYNGQIVSWKYRKNGKYRITETYNEVGRKNGKSTTAGGLAGYFMTAMAEQEAQIYTLATSKKQAKESFNAFKSLAKSQPKYAKTLVMLDNQIRHTKSNSFFEPLASTGERLDGKNPFFVNPDEVHLYTPKDDMSLKSLQGGVFARKHYLIYKTTTAGSNIFGSCYAEREMAIRVLRQQQTLDFYLPLIFTLDKDDDVFDPINWYKANPALSISKDLSLMEKMFEMAQARERDMNMFKNKQLNIWTTASDNWLKLEQWQACENKNITYESLKGLHCIIGADLSDTSDLTALVLLFPPQANFSKWQIYPLFFVPATQAIKREQIDKVPYCSWHEQKHINLVKSGRISKLEILAYIREVLSKDFEIDCFAYDPWHAGEIADGLISANIPTLAVRQGYQTLSPACKRFEEMLDKKEIEHNGNTCLAWNVSNAVVDRDANNNIKLNKRTSTEKIDGLAALINAIVATLTTNNKQKVITECPILLI